MVLAVQWLESLGQSFGTSPSERSPSCRTDTEYAEWPRTAPPGTLTLLSTKGDIMADLLLHFDSLFAELTGLPP
jgi:hypothetical protein